MTSREIWQRCDMRGTLPVTPNVRILFIVPSTKNFGADHINLSTDKQSVGVHVSNL